VKKMLFKMLLCVTVGLFFSGCEPLTSQGGDADSDIRIFDSLSILKRYTPTSVTVMPLTKFEETSSQPSQTHIHIYVGLIDAYGTQIKSPSTFRFELYEKIALSTQPKGSRIVMWPDMDLNDPKVNNKYWSDFFRAYEFRLAFEPKQGKSYILQVTAINSDSKRLTDEITIDAP